ncbi:related to Putative adenylate kinase FAP7 [Hanseniaspora guilliermondii]|uniref:Adenylate kinase isoenzyme 6 homolog n=1 Tax=Hanseniaspora guilliermondii TaxID=56406 RepID=A0A1L0B637_9ASCO|nr:related to Putative adenylate kinase FAP7 [Hanseniaspora guilliermondii]
MTDNKITKEKNKVSKLSTDAVEKALNKTFEEPKLKKTRFRPNIIITGTPGCGKSTLSKTLKEMPDLKIKLFNISEYAKENKIFESYDETRDSHVIDEDELLDRLETPLREGGCIVDWHCNDIFPERLIDFVVVLRCGTSALYHRLKARNYKDSKIQENIDAEIMSVVLEDALDSYDKRIVIELQNDEDKNIQENVDKIKTWIEQWVLDNKTGVTNEIDEFYKDRDMPEDWDSDEE